MDRAPRAAVGGLVYHVLNRANARHTLFVAPADYAAFEQVLAEAQDQCPVALLGYCVMPNHWHLVLAPEKDGDLSRFVGWLTLTHTQRRHAHRHTAGTGHLYQGRFKSFPVEADDHFLTVCRYVERNALRAGLVRRAEEWRWGSLARRVQEVTGPPVRLGAWPVPVPGDWLAWVNAPQTAAEEAAVRRCGRRGRPYGSAAWVSATVARLGLGVTLRSPGRPRKPRAEHSCLPFDGNGS
jgi:putative transposase